MTNPRLAARYAKSLLGLALERSQLEQVYQDILFLQRVCGLNREFVVMLKSPVIHADKKISILDTLSKGRVNETVLAFTHLLVAKGRESYLPEILTAFVEQYKSHKGIFSVKLITAQPVSEEIRQQIMKKANDFAPDRTIDLEVEVREELIGGFQLELGGTLVDGSVAYELSKIKSQFLNSDFIYKIR